MQTSHGDSDASVLKNTDLKTVLTRKSFDIYSSQLVCCAHHEAFSKGNQSCLIIAPCIAATLLYGTNDNIWPEASRCHEARILTLTWDVCPSFVLPKTLPVSLALSTRQRKKRA